MSLKVEVNFDVNSGAQHELHKCLKTQNEKPVTCVCQHS